LPVPIRFKRSNGEGESAAMFYPLFSKNVVLPDVASNTC